MSETTPTKRKRRSKGGLAGAASATSPLDRGGVQKTLRQVALDCGLKFYRRS